MTLDISFTPSMVRSVSFVQPVPLLARHSPSIELTLTYTVWIGTFDLQVTLFEYNPIWYVENQRPEVF